MAKLRKWYLLVKTEQMSAGEAGKAATAVKRPITRLRERNGIFLRVDKNEKPVATVNFLILWTERSRIYGKLDVQQAPESPRKSGEVLFRSTKNHSFLLYSSLCIQWSFSNRGQTVFVSAADCSTACYPDLSLWQLCAGWRATQAVVMCSWFPFPLPSFNLQNHLK